MIRFQPAVTFVHLHQKVAVSVGDYVSILLSLSTVLQNINGESFVTDLP